MLNTLTSCAASPAMGLENADEPQNHPELSILIPSSQTGFGNALGCFILEAGAWIPPLPSARKYPAPEFFR